jgi:hypothetical protein
MADQAQAAAHWDTAYAQGDDIRSWYEKHPDMSLRMLASAGLSADDALIGVGGGASPLTRALTSWPGYCLVAAQPDRAVADGESSFNAAPLHASLPAITAAEPIAGIALGIVVFDDVVRVSPGVITLQAAGLAATVVGVIMVARAPARSSLRPAHLIHAHRAASRTATASLTARAPAAPLRLNLKARQRSRP